MTSIEVRPFRRGDREQPTALVNAHAAAVIPGVWVSVGGGWIVFFDYAWPQERESIAFLEAVGFRELTRTERGWVRQTSMLRQPQR
jgi:hypothetical protein